MRTCRWWADASPGVVNIAAVNRAAGPSRDRPRVVFVSQWFHVRPSSGLIHSTVGALRAVGPTVVVSGPPLYKGWRGKGHEWPWWRRGAHVVGDVPVARYPYTHGHDSSEFRRTAMYASFASSSLLSVPSILRHADVSVVYGSPVTAASASLAARRIYGVPYVLIVQDVWPDSVFASGFLTEGGPSRAAHALLGAFTGQVYEHASAIVVISESMGALLLSRGVPEGKLTTIYNWADESLHPEALRVPDRAPGDPLRILYAGSMGEPQGLEVILKALALLPGADYRLDLVGSGVSEGKLRSLVARLGLGNVTFHGRREPHQMREMLSTADVHFVSLRDHPLFSVTVPSKIQSLLLAGVPIVGSLNGEPGALVERAGAGWVAPAADVGKLATLLSQVRAAPQEELRRRGAAGREFYFRQMAQSVGHARLAEVVGQAVADR